VRVPLVPAAVAMILGVVAGKYLPLPTGFYIVLGAGAVVAAALTLLRPHLHAASVAAIATAVFCVGAAHLRLAYFALPEDHVVSYTQDSPILATLRGQIVTTPQTLQDDPRLQLGYRRPSRTTFILEARAIRTGDTYRPASGLLRATVREQDNRLAAGQTVELVGTLGRFRGADNPGQQDWAETARLNRTPAWMTVPAPDGVTILGEPSSAWERAYWRVRAAARQHVTACGDAQEGDLLNALITGERSPALSDLNRMMVEAGVAHYLSISGSHLAVFLGFIYLLCRLATLPPRRAGILVLAVLAMYLLVAEPQAPLLRSAIMAAAVCLAAITHRQNSAINAMAAAMIVLLLADPLQLFTPGLQLSFAIVAGMILLQRPMRDLLFGGFLRRRGLMVFRQKDRARRWLHFSVANFGISVTTLALTAYAVSAPLVAYHFGRFSPYATVLSVLMAPLMTTVLVPGYLSLALAWPLPNLSYAMGQAASQAAGLLQKSIDAMQWLPGLSLEMRPVSAAWVLLAYAALLAAVLWRKIPLGKFVAPAMTASLAAATVWTQLPATRPPAAELHLLSIGVGQCAVLRTPDGKTFLIDAGTRGGFDAATNVLEPFLRSQKFPAPSAAFVSHANADHYNALPAYLARHSLGRIYLGERFDLTGRMDYESALSQLFEAMQTKNVPIERLCAGQKISLDDRTTAEVVWPPAGFGLEPSTDINDTSLVLRIVCDGRCVLVTGDISDVAQSKLSPQADSIRSDVLVMPHHGSWRQSLPAFVGAVNPKFLLTSSSRGFSIPSGNPAAEAFFSGLRTKYICRNTAREGWIRVRFGAGKVEVRTMR
jgi:competence protein ComEC